MEAVKLSSDATSVVVSRDHEMPEILYIGRALGPFDPAALNLPVARGALDTPAPLGLITEGGTGFGGRPGLVGARPDGTAWSPVFSMTAKAEVDDRSARFVLRDDVAELQLDLALAITEAETVVVTARLTNLGRTDFGLLRLAPSIPLPAFATELQTFTGRWCREFQPQRSELIGLTIVENRKGRTSHDRMPAVFAGTEGFSEQRGDVWGAQLGWSGNYEMAAERISDGRRHIQAGELLSPGEVVLGPGASYESPEVVIAWSDAGLTPASQAFHRHVRLRHPLNGTRKVILNTWEAVYFDHDLSTLQALADVAAEVGVERFVLDDGWFAGRRDDTAGLGDWWVSDAVWPDGLHPIVDHVGRLGMEFGLWVEPEMVNPDSDLFRNHPEWVLTTPGYEPVLGRNQLVLDCGRAEVRQYLLERLDALLAEYAIAYMKWDMNRDVVQGSHHGRPGTHGHVRGVYELIDRLRASHPDIEIESCASGGGRADLEILRRTDRIWTSDCNDGLERQAIQRGFSMLFPPEVMGAHIGPNSAHTTKRHQRLGFRAATALFGHIGIEWNLLAANEEERALVAAAVALHKRLRPLLHSGDVVRVDSDDPAVLVHGVVSPDRLHAVMAFVQLVPSLSSVPLPMRFAGLDAEFRYRVKIIDELESAVEHGRTRPTWMEAEPEVTGAQLMGSGLRPPILQPESVFLLELLATR